MRKYEHTTVVLRFDEKTFASARTDMLQGLAPASAKSLQDLGSDGWELVAVMPYVSSSTRLMRQPGTDAALGFFKRGAEN